MRVLITNNRLDRRGGAEGVVRDLAIGLQKRGHTVVAYTSHLGDLPRLLEFDGVPVCTDLAKLPFKPDIIHGQHHLDAMTAILSLPGVPAVYHCHGGVWRDTPPLHPRIGRYVAMSPTLKERIMTESNLPDAAVEVILNGVNLDTFRTTRQPPEKLRCALFYNGYHLAQSLTLEAVEKACAAENLDFERAGKRSFKRFDSPQTDLLDYDLVFASGKSALDALACGCAVIILGRNTCGPLVTPENFEQLRQANFSVAAHLPPRESASIQAEIQKYRAADTVEVTRLTRTKCDINLVVDRLLAIYEEVIAQSRHQTQDLPSEIAATAAYLRKLVPLVKLIANAQDDAIVPVVTLESLHATRAQAERLLRELNLIL